MRRMKVMTVLLVFGLVASAALATETLVQPTGATASVADGNRPATKATEGSGLSDATIVETGDPAPEIYPSHNTNSGDMWRSPNGNDGVGEWIAFELGDAYDLSGFHLWNYNETWGDDNQIEAERGIQVATIEYSIDNGVNWISLGDMTFLQAPGASDYTGEDYSFSGPLLGVTDVRFTVVSNFNNADRSGISEIRFIQADSFVNATNPDPSFAEENVEVDLLLRSVSGALSWDAPTDPNVVTIFGYNVYIDPNEMKVFNATPGSTDLEFKSLQSDGQTGTIFDPGADLGYLTTYYWRIDPVLDFDYITGATINDANTITGAVWSFTTKPQDMEPVVDAGESIITTLELAQSPIALSGSVTDDGTSGLTINWEAYEIAWGGGVTSKVTFADAADPSTTVTVSESGTYVLKLSATDATGTVSDQTETVVYVSDCDAAKATGAHDANYYDRDDNCIVNLLDFAVFALEWLDSTALTESYFYQQDVDVITEDALLAEYWLGVSGGEPNDLIEDPRYPATPDGAYLVVDELRGLSQGSEYGQRIRGYIVPPTTGSYTFYVAADDSARLFLSADTTPVDTDPALGNQITEVSAWTPVDDWGKYPEQTSEPISLTAGQYYYMEILHKQGSGGDNVSVGWSTDGGTTIEVIPAAALKYALP